MFEGLFLPEYSGTEAVGLIVIALALTALCIAAGRPRNSPPA
jgi:hypothetical protein